MPLDNKNAFVEPDNPDTRYSDLINQIGALLWLNHVNGSLSHEQLGRLADLRNQIEVYGERAERWIQSCDRTLDEQPESTKYESMMDFYTKFVNSFDCPPVLIEAATNMFKEVLLESSQSSAVAEQLRQMVGLNPHEAHGVNIFGISGNDDLPQEATIDKEISDAMISGSFDALGDDIAMVDPNDFNETAMGLGSSEQETSGNDLNPDDWTTESTATEEDATEDATEESDEEENEAETNTTDTSGDLETLDI